MNNSFNPYFANTQCPPFGANYGWNAPSFGGFTGNYGWNAPSFGGFTGNYGWNAPSFGGFTGNYGWNAPSYGGFTGNYGWNGPTYWNQPQHQSQSCSTPSWWGNGSAHFAQNNTNSGPCESMPTWDTNAA